MEREGIIIPDNLVAAGEDMISAYINEQKFKPAGPPADPPAPVDPPAPADPPADPPAPPADTPAPLPPTVSVEEYEKLKSRLKEFEEKKTPEFNADIDPDYYRLGILAKKDPVKFELFKQLKLNKNIDPVQLMVYDHISKNPEDVGKEADIEKFIKRKYKLHTSPPSELSPDDFSEEEVSKRKSEIDEYNDELFFAKKSLELEAKKVKSELEQEFSAIDLPVSKVISEDERKANIETAKTEWTPVVGEIMKVMTHIPIFTQKADKEEPQEILKYEIPADLKLQYEQRLLEHLSSNQIPVTKEAVEKAASIFLNTFKQENEARINHAFAGRIRSMTEAEYDQKYANPSAIRDISNPPPVELSKAEEGRRQAAEAEGFRY